MFLTVYNEHSLFFYFETGNYYNSLKTHCFSSTGMNERQEDPRTLPPLHPLPACAPPPLLHPQGSNGHWWLKALPTSKCVNIAIISFILEVLLYFVIGFMFNLLIGQMTTAHYTLVDNWCPNQYGKVLTRSISALIIGIFIFINI